MKDTKITYRKIAVSVLMWLGLIVGGISGSQADTIYITSMGPLDTFNDIGANTPLEFWVFEDHGSLPSNQIEISAMEAFVGNSPILLAGRIFDFGSNLGPYTVSSVYHFELQNALGFGAYTLYRTNITKQGFCVGKSGLWVIHIRSWGAGFVTTGDLASLGIGPGNGAPSSGPGWDNRWVSC